MKKLKVLKDPLGYVVSYGDTCAQGGELDQAYENLIVTLAHVFQSQLEEKEEDYDHLEKKFILSEAEHKKLKGLVKMIFDVDEEGDLIVRAIRCTEEFKKQMEPEIKKYLK